MSASAGEDGAAHLAVGIDRCANLTEQRAVALFAKRIAALRTVYGERHDGAVFIDQKRRHVFLENQREDNVTTVHQTKRKTPLTGGGPFWAEHHRLE